MGIGTLSAGMGLGQGGFSLAKQRPAVNFGMWGFFVKGIQNGFHSYERGFIL